MNKYLVLFCIVISYSFVSDGFKNQQLKYSRVQEAYDDYQEDVLSLLHLKRIDERDFSIYLRAFKREKEIELWGKNTSDKEYTLIKTYDICKTSGKLGPKRKQGDSQIPEGFYHINRFNPQSQFHLSLGLNYPNRSDVILGKKNKLGGDIFIHGSCVTRGCLPITDEGIKELYVFCIEAKNAGQKRIPVTMFPCHLYTENYEKLCVDFYSNKKLIGLWTDLKIAYEIFNETGQLPNIRFLDSGRHKVFQ